MKTSKFLFAENPLSNDDDNSIFVIHARNPVIIARVFHFDNSDDEQLILDCKRQFTCGASLDYPPEYIVFGAIYVQENKLHPDKLAGIMRRMADWYESYLIWEDKNISNNII